MDLFTATKDERNLLLYLESCSVEYGGTVDLRRMNKEDLEIAKLWKELGYITEWRRIPFDALPKNPGAAHVATYLVTLSDEAWKDAHQERRNRNGRLMDAAHVKKYRDAEYRA